MRRQTRVPTIVVLAFLIAGLAAGVLFVNTRQVFRLRAAPELAPKDIRITNVTDSSFTVSWTTKDRALGFISWGDRSDNLRRQGLSETEMAYTHSTTVKNLSKSSVYYFTITTGGVTADNNGVPWRVETGPNIKVEPSANIISGTVMDSAGNPVGGALVYATSGGGGMISTLTSQDGSWFLPVSQIREQSLSSYVDIGPKTLIEVSVNAGSAGVASAKIYPENAHPAPPISLGKFYDFTRSSYQIPAIPEAEIALPESLGVSSGFDF